MSAKNKPLDFKENKVGNKQVPREKKNSFKSTHF